MNAPTVYDVAARAGVSIATVSRVYRAPDSVRGDTRRRVLDAAKELDYVPSGSARGLASRSTQVLGLCFPDFSDPVLEQDPDADDAEVMLYSDEVIRGMERAARRHGYALLIAAAHADTALERAFEVVSHVDGLAMLAFPAPGQEAASLARQRPVVFLAGVGNGGYDHVEVANYQGQLELTRHLLVDHGRRRLAFVGGHADSPDGEARFRGFQAAHREAGLPVPEAPDVRADLTRAAGYAAVAEVLDGAGRPDGLVFANDQMAVGGLDALRGRGIRVPDELVVTGFDGIPLGRLVRPALTTVRQPMGRLGEEAVELLLARIADHDRPAEDRVLDRKSVV